MGSTEDKLTTCEDGSHILSLESKNEFSLGKQCLLIDPQNTLHDSTIARRWFFSLITKCGKQASYEEFFQAWDSDFLPELNAGSGDYWQQFSSFLRSKDFSIGHTDELVRAVQGKFPLLEIGGRPYVGIRDILTNLKQYHYTLVLFAHSRLTGQQYNNQVVLPSLGSFFDQVLTTSDLCNTSELCPYQALAQGLGLSASRNYFVSSTESRVVQAQKAGFSTVSIKAKHLSDKVNHSLNTWADLIPLCSSHSINKAA